MNKSNQSAYYTLIFIFVASISTIGLLIERHQSGILGFAYFSAFFSYFWLVRFHRDSRFLFSLGIFARLMLFLSLPTLSDDIYRFIWDGRILDNGLNPYAHLPQFYLNQDNLVGLDQLLFDRLNSKPYFTIYPPLNQLIFWLSVHFGNDSFLITANIIRTLILAADIGLFLLLRKILLNHKLEANLSFWFLLNPLIILEFTGNIHFEAFVIFFILLALFLLRSKKLMAGSLALGGAIATKLLPMIFLPAMLFRYKWKKGILMVSLALIATALTFIPIISTETISNLETSFDLYFRKFEFNASIYFILREIGFFMTGYNIIDQLGPALSVLDIIAIISLAIFGNRAGWKIEKIWLFILFTHLLLSTTVHPWYTLPLIPLGLIAGYYFPILWSLMIFSTYFGYSQSGFELSPIWVVFEYGSVFTFLIFEILNKRNESFG